MALGLLRLGLQRGDRIVIAAEDVPQWFYADLGAQMIGVQVVGIYPTNPWPEVQYIAAHCQAQVAITGDQEQTDKVLDAMANGNGLPQLKHIYCVDMKGLRRYAAGPPDSFARLMELGDELAAEDRRCPAAPGCRDRLPGARRREHPRLHLRHDGPAKGAMLTHRNIVYGAYAYAAARRMLGKRFESVCYLPLCHLAERTYSTGAASLTGGMRQLRRIDRHGGAPTSARSGPTFFLGVPRIWEKLQQGFEFRVKDSGRLQQWLYRVGMKRGRALSDRRAEHGRLVGTLRDKLEFALLVAAARFATCSATWV